MATWYLINHIIVAGGDMLPGTLVDDSITSLTPLQAAGGLFWSATDANAIAGAKVAQHFHGDIAMMEGAMFAAIGKSLITASSIQSGSVTLVAGTATVNTGVTLTSSSKIVFSVKTPGGTLPTGGYDCPNASRTVGAPGAASFTINAIVQADGSTQTACTSTLDYMIIG